MNELIWQQAYDAWVTSGMSRAEFYRTRIQAFFPENTPCLYSLYRWFRRLERKLAVEPPPSANAVAVVQIPGHMTRKTVRSSGSTSERMPYAKPLRFAGRSPREVRLTLPNGALLEFSSDAPELFAIGMMRAAGGAS